MVVPPKLTKDELHEVTTCPLDTVGISAAVARSSDGAVCMFVGLVRDHNAGRQVLWLDYEAYAPLALRSFTQIAEEVAAIWPGARMAIRHRIGRVDIGEASVVIGASAPHRADAFAACRYAIERVKQIAPVWKHEHFVGGEIWIEGATADPADEAARQTALERACT
jgi:molybdopterin synthase catalytic subunit